MDKVEQIKKVLDEIRKFIVQDGGDIEFVDFDEKSGILKIRLQGACVGCPMSGFTLKQGIEETLMQKLDFVKGVEDLTHQGFDL